MGTTSTNDYIAEDQVKATVFGVDSVHPIRSDFATDQEGKVLISAKHGGGFHTTAITTRAGTAAQTVGTNVTISAYVLPLPPAGYTNLTVYFEVTDPDDLSHYEGKTVPGTPTVQGDENPNDNRDPAKRMTTGTGADYTLYQTRCLTAGGRSARVEPATIAGTDRAVAETTLQITSQFSGDNYQVRATMQKPHNLEPFDKRYELDDQRCVCYKLDQGIRNHDRLETRLYRAGQHVHPRSHHHGRCGRRGDQPDR
jgi:hypothetical protein